LSEAVAKLASITFSRLSLLSWTIDLGFLTEGKSCCYIHHTFLLGFPTGWSFTMHQGPRPSQWERIKRIANSIRRTSPMDWELCNPPSPTTNTITQARSNVLSLQEAG
jgi:hypothetical protein